MSLPPILGIEWEPPPPMRQDLSRQEAPFGGPSLVSALNHTRRCYPPPMATEKRVPRNQPTQTTPKGAEIPVPKRGDFMRDLRKVTAPKEDSPK